MLKFPVNEQINVQGVLNQVTPTGPITVCLKLEF
uniref:Uncharacterized protein n=1 Tax=Arundo donax TaxID=35708 RepID=A0A0A9EI40_ARUDO